MIIVSVSSEMSINQMFKIQSFTISHCQDVPGFGLIFKVVNTLAC